MKSGSNGEEGEEEEEEGDAEEEETQETSLPGEQENSDAASNLTEVKEEVKQTPMVPKISFRVSPSGQESVCYRSGSALDDSQDSYFFHTVKSQLKLPYFPHRSRTGLQGA